MNIVSLIRTVDRNVKMRAKDEVSAVEMLNVQLAIMTLCVHVNKVSLMMAKVDVKESNARKTMNAHRTNSVKRISVNWRVKAENHAVKKPFVRLKTIDQFAIVNQVTAEIHTNNVTLSIIVAMHLADQELYVRITKELSIALAVTDTLVIHTMKAVA